ncbi:similar to Saccharomyces cerevisiae YMR047C NUP116 Subunit of the Nup82 subcomplex of the nuclear pore complex [Maudiozyma saulgeensis]|uniref:Similar to Saccharomyces cerevisiae YMR047C NUP116 Subunit of the Nup82 subcomplex of the nuclear pore complex n=1 Tax=Maudiozyma saulgeensis TaxID=1789683 RepID=A0A1X7R7V7_9SACH|nr:similar to Saccharomyces cerevisiae YMR047C NUP116 Subunit of the Nup82 subcomplex of the nuclear pore complex [Kazachstania saulgeensis]
MFGLNRSTFGGASAQQAPSNASPFGAQQTNTNSFGMSQPNNTTQQPQQSFGGFGMNNTTANNATGFGSNNTANTGMFGPNTNTSAGTTMFGNNSSGMNTNPLLGNSINQASSNNGTGIKPFTAYQEKDPVSNATNVFQSITCMPEYRNYSFEELRYQDYQVGRKFSNSQVPVTNTTGMNSFGQNSVNSTNTTTSSGGLFGGNTNANNNTTGGLFGQKPNAGFGANTSTGLFGNSNNNNSNAMNSPFNSKPQGNTGLFGQQNNNTTGFGLQNNTSTFGQNNPNTFGQQQTNSNNLFGMNNNPSTTTGGIFGQSNNNTFGQQNTTTSGGLYGQNNNQQQGGLFGNKPTSVGLFGQNNNNTFGNNNANTNTAGMFGQNNNLNQGNTSGTFGQANNNNSMFGNNNANTGFGGQQNNVNSFNQNQSAGGLFGNKSAGGLFGQTNNTSQQQGGLFGSKPATGGLFGQNNAQQPQQGGLFGQTGTQPAQVGGPFGQNNNQQQSSGGLFGQNNNQQQGGLFGAKPVTGGLFGQNSNQQNSAGGQFGQNNSQQTNAMGGGLFGQNNQQSTQAGGLFGAKPAAPVGGGLFGNNNQQQQPVTGGLFGAKPAGSTFGGNGLNAGTNASGSLFGNNINNANNTSNQSTFGGNTTGGLFGAKPAAPVGGGLFGNNNATNGLGTATGGGLFGSKPSTATQGGGLFGNNNPTGLNNSSVGTGLFGAQKPMSSMLGSQTQIGGQAPQTLAQQQNLITHNPFGSDNLFNRIVIDENGLKSAKTINITKVNADIKKNNTLTGAYKLVPKPLFSTTQHIHSEDNCTIHKILPPKGSALNNSTDLSGSAQGNQSLETRPSLLLTSKDINDTSGVPEKLLFNPEKKTFKDFLQQKNNVVVENKEVLKTLEQQELKDQKIPLKESTKQNLPPKTENKAETVKNDVNSNKFEVVADSENKLSPPGIQTTDFSFIDDNYYISPSISTLSSMSLLDLRKVDHLIIGHNLYGKVEFLKPVDLSDIPVALLCGKYITLKQGSCKVIPYSGEDMVAGSGINVPSRITIYHCYPTNRENRQPIKDPHHSIVKRHIEKLRKIQNAKFETYDPVSGNYTFTVQTPI